MFKQNTNLKYIHTAVIMEIVHSNFVEDEKLKAAQNRVTFEKGKEYATVYGTNLNENWETP